MSSYGYWLSEKGWIGKGWISTMRIDAKVADTLTAIFAMVRSDYRGAVSRR
ncbi:MAG: hypothetical protein M0Z65_11915 [Firmicutes bacterium]|uniref:Uncharacterized protein n=1 Tax=Melghirimyces thermohalophilus TaxID=1236220 RepID=A0A1G6LBA4_9BACL|nr:hypothetical protein [Melghirimyces thermohalophilus]MDA8353857.1 hypothetical protein [Bacillota bacterium]SDC40448.1 hypothetical protein SAMN04488112_107145 [Melghirimyces thermohalophilus]